MVLSQCVSNSTSCPILSQRPRCRWARRSVPRWSTAWPRAFSTGGSRCTGPCPSPLASAGTSSSGCGARGSATDCAPCATRSQCWSRTTALLMDSLKWMYQPKEHSVLCTKGFFFGCDCLFDCVCLDALFYLLSVKLEFIYWLVQSFAYGECFVCLLNSHGILKTLYLFFFFFWTWGVLKVQVHVDAPAAFLCCWNNWSACALRCM